MTQEEVSLKSEVSSSHISNLENGKVNPRYGTLKSLASALGVDCSQILALAEIYAAGRD